MESSQKKMEANANNLNLNHLDHTDPQETSSITSPRRQDPDDTLDDLGLTRTTCKGQQVLQTPIVPEEIAGTTDDAISDGHTSEVEIPGNCNVSIKSSSSNSMESFHSVNEHTYLLPEELSGADDKSEGSDSQHIHSDLEDEELLRDKKSFEQDGVVSLYSSSRKGTRRNGYHRYDSRTQISKDDIMNCSFHGETCGILETEEEESTLTAVQLQHMDHYDRKRNSIDGSVRSDSRGSNLTSPEIDGLPLPYSPANELRQRSRFSANRTRSYTSPDSRSLSQYQSDEPTTTVDPFQYPQLSLLSSLDAGMSSLRRWVISHSPGRDGSHRRSRTSRAAALAQTQTDDLESGYSSAGGGSLTSLHVTQPLRSPFQSYSVDSNEYTTYSGTSHPQQGTIHYPQTIAEEDEQPTRQRAHSEPERSRWMSFNGRQIGRDQNWRFRRQPRTLDAASIASLESGGNSLPPEMIFDVDSSEHLSRVSFQVGSHDHAIELTTPSSGNNSIESALERPDSDAHLESPLRDARMNWTRFANNQTHELELPESLEDPNREARMNWIRITRRFQLLVVLVGLIFSVLLFSIMVTWVVLMSAYVVSIDDGCDLPLKPYFWLATIQLMLDVFRKEIMKVVFRFDSSRQGQRIPTKVIFYNLAYLTYAMLVLRLGVQSVFMTEESLCPHTAKKLFNTTKVFVSISIAAWLLVLFGYLLPFCLVAILLTRNGFSPETELNQGAGQNIVVPLSNRNSGAPPGCIDKLKAVTLEDFDENFPNECCVSLKIVYIISWKFMFLTNYCSCCHTSTIHTDLYGRFCDQ